MASESNRLYVDVRTNELVPQTPEAWRGYHPEIDLDQACDMALNRAKEELRALGLGEDATVQDVEDAKRQKSVPVNQRPKATGCFTVDQLIRLAKLGAEVCSKSSFRPVEFIGAIIPGCESSTFDEIKTTLRERFPDGVIIADIS